jgi:CubicO group peptidase (beta-lactamase class C family)
LILLLPAIFLLSCAPYGTKSAFPSAIDALFSDYNQPHSPGASVAIIKDSKVLFSRTYGFANLEDHEVTTTATNYRLASVTKQFTAMAILILTDRGALSLDSRLTNVLPGAPSYAHNVRVRHLLNHTSGIVDYESLIPDTQTVQVLDNDVLALLCKIDSTCFPAGSKYQYSNSGYALLALIVESVAKQSFAEFLKKNIFEPLGMDHAVAYQRGFSTVANRAYGYSRTDSGFARTDQSTTSAVLGDGGIYSSVDDLFKWDQALYTERLVRASALQQAFTPAVLNDGTRTTYGFGWNIELYRNIPSLFHSGSTQGFRNAILRFPLQRSTIIILTNRNQGNPIEIARKIADLVLFEREQ